MMNIIIMFLMFKQISSSFLRLKYTASVTLHIDQSTNRPTNTLTEKLHGSERSHQFK